MGMLTIACEVDQSSNVLQNILLA